MNISLFELFIIFFKINAITFGGGYTIVPIISNEFAKNKKLLSEDEMYDIVALAQSGPGAMAISTSFLTGYRLRGFWGAIVCLIASTLPCLIILSIVSMFYVQFKTNFFVRSILDGISGIICAILLVTVYEMGKNATKKYKYFSSIIIFLVFILSFFFKVDTAKLIFGSAVIAILTFYLRNGDVK